MADEYPSAEIIGTDISPVQPSWTPPNCSFQIDDAQLDWTFKKDHFDFVHIRNLYGGIKDWPRLYRQAFDHLKPGGWFENVEIDIEPRSENPAVTNDQAHVFKKWCKLFYEAGDKQGRTFQIACDGRMEKYMRETGFQGIVHKQWKIPIGAWPQDPHLKRIGQYSGLFVDQSLDGFAVFPIGEILGWSQDEVTVLVAQMRKAITDLRSLPYFVLYVMLATVPILRIPPPPYRFLLPFC